MKDSSKNSSIRPGRSRRAKNLKPGRVEEIVALLDGWPDKLTWKLLIDKVYARWNVRYSRQALATHSDIASAFASKKMTLRSSIPQKRHSKDSEKQLLLQRVERLEGQVTRLQGENSALLERFVRWSYNAYLRGLDESTLNREMPSVDRDRTRLAVSRGKHL